jgi:hypothetical protein
MMDEQGFSEAVGRLEKVSEVVGKLDPAIRSAAFAALSGYVSGSRSPSFGEGVLDLAGGDVEELVFVVMMEAAKSAEDDLKQIMNGVRSITAAKQELRELICKVANDIAANTGREQGTISFGSDGLGSEEAYHRTSLPLPSPRCDGGVVLTVTDLHPGAITEVGQLRSIRHGLEGKLDSMSEMSEMTSLRLQMAMDRRSKFISTLSNIMKKISETQDTVVQNLK